MSQGPTRANPNAAVPAPPTRRFGRVLVLVLLGAVVFFGLGEVLARSFNLVDRLNGFPRRLFMATDDEQLPYLLRPGTDTIARGVHVVVNERGMRGKEISEQAAPGVHRILAIGDSVTFGYRLEEEQAYPHLLGQELSRRTGEPFEVLNGGIEGYNTENQLAWLRRYGLALRPETIVVAFNLNDYDYGPVMGPLGILTLDRSERVSTSSIANLSEFYLLLRWLVATRGQVWVGDGAQETAKAEGDFDPFDRYVSALRKQYYRAPADERWKLMGDSLQGLRDVARENGIELVVAILPDGDQVGTPEADRVPQEKLLALCAELEIDCLDLLPAFEAAPDEPLFMDIMHPNAAGHRVIADAVAAHLAGKS